MKSWRSLALILSLVSLSACAAPLRFTSSYCAPTQRHYAMTLRDEPALSEADGRDARMAALLGVANELRTRQTGQLSDSEKLRVLTRLEQARLEVAASKAEVDCEGERTKQALDYLTERRERTVQALTVASIVLTGATAVASVVMAVRDAPAARQIGIGAGGAAGGTFLSIQSLYVEPTVELRYNRNLLADIWNGPKASEIYPPIVWAYLTHPSFSNEGGASTREKMITRFCAAGSACSEEFKRTLIFGGGGSFDVATLRMRAALLDKLKVEIDLVHQGLSFLAEQLLQ